MSIFKTSFKIFLKTIFGVF